MENKKEIENILLEEAKQENYICEHCDERKPDTVYRINPYIEEIGHEIVYEYICDDCYIQCVMDI